MTPAPSNDSPAAPRGATNDVAVLYVLTVLAMASIGVVIPLIGDLASALSASPEAVGLALALYSLPSALLAGLLGDVVNRFGARRVMLVAGLVSLAADPILVFAPNLAALNIALLVAGLGFAATSIAAPTLLMSVTAGPPQLRAMSIWSTYPPAGLSVGLLMAVPFAAGPHWRDALWLHAATLVAALAWALTLTRPAVAPPMARRSPLAGLGVLLSTLRDPAVLGVSLSSGLAAALAYGVALVAPTYLAKAHGFTVSTASSFLAVANLATILGGVVAGHLLAKRINPRAIFAAVALLAAIALAVVFTPGLGATAIGAALVAWLFLSGAAIAISTAFLPLIAKSPEHGASAAGIMGQAISLCSFAVPTIYFGLLGREAWGGFIYAGVIGLAIALVVLPGPGRRAGAA